MSLTFVRYTLMCFEKYDGALLRVCFFVSLRLCQDIFSLDLFPGLAWPVLQAQWRFGGNAWLEVGGAWCWKSCCWVWADFPPPLTKSSLATGSPLCQGLLRRAWAKPTTGLLDERGEQQGGTPWTQGHPTILMTLSLVPLSLAHNIHHQSINFTAGCWCSFNIAELNWAELSWPGLCYTGLAHTHCCTQYTQCSRSNGGGKE